MTSPLVTIGITCFNAEDTIARAIDSARAQDYPNIQIVVVDDCSEDRSLAAIESFPDAQIVRHVRNLGVAAARNTILTHALGAFVAFFDDDDVSVPGRVSAQISAILQYEHVNGRVPVACYASGWKQYPNGYRALFDAVGSRPVIPVGWDMVDYQLFMPRRPGVFFGNGTPACSLAARRETLLAVDGFDAALRRSEDTDLAIRLGQIGCHFIGCAGPLVIQYASAGRDKCPEIGLESDLAILEKHRALFDRRERYSFAVGWTRFKFYHYSGQAWNACRTLCLLFARFPYWTIRRFLKSVPARRRHEKKMAA